MFNTRMILAILSFCLVVSAQSTATDNAAMKEFLNYLDMEILLPCEYGTYDKKDELVACIQSSYQDRKDSELMNGLFPDITPQDMEELESYFEDIARTCSENDPTILQFNYCIKEKYFSKYDIEMTVADHASKDFLQYLDGEVLHYCENDANVQENANIQSLLICIQIRYQWLKSTPIFEDHVENLNSSAVRRLETYYHHIVQLCDKIAGDAIIPKFNECIVKQYNVLYGYQESRQLQKALSRLLRILEKTP